MYDVHTCTIEWYMFRCSEGMTCCSDVSCRDLNQQDEPHTYTHSSGQYLHLQGWWNRSSMHADRARNHWGSTFIHAVHKTEHGMNIVGNAIINVDCSTSHSHYCTCILCKHFPTFTSSSSVGLLPLAKNALHDLCYTLSTTTWTCSDMCDSKCPFPLRWTNLISHVDVHILST